MTLRAEDMSQKQRDGGGRVGAGGEGIEMETVWDIANRIE